MPPMPVDPCAVVSAAHRGGRVPKSCLECKRLKRKCDRQWPCNHCVARRSADLCHFEQAQSHAINEPAARKRKLESTSISIPSSSDGLEQPDMPALSDIDSEIDAASALKALGYVGSDVFRSISTAAPVSQVTRIQPELENALRAVPPRPYTDILIQTFFESVNYQYQSIDHPTFMKSYTEWWSRRRLPQQSIMKTDLAFTGLVLQMCSTALQFASSSTLAKIESDLAEPPESFSFRLFSTARQLSAFISPGEGGLVQVQQLFIGASWYKTQAELTNAWHALASAIREAQEIGMHIDSASQPISTHEREMRRRMWYILYVWDSSISASFGRPLLITRDNLVPLPNPRIDQLTTGAEIPSAATVITVEYQLWKYLVHVAPTDANVTATLAFVEQWMASLPEAFSFHQPNRSWDTEHPILPFQRLKLHCMGYSARLAFLRPYLVAPKVQTLQSDSGSSYDEDETETVQRIGFAVDTALELMSSSKELFTLLFPDKARYFMVSFCPFDTAAVLCSALMHDKEGSRIPRRLEVVEAIGCGLYISHHLRGLAKLGVATSSILVKLVSQLSLSDTERQAMDHVRRYGCSSTDLTSVPDAGETSYNGQSIEPSPLIDMSGTDERRSEEPSYLSNGSNIAAAVEEPWGEVFDTAGLEPQIDFDFLGGPWNWDESVLPVADADNSGLQFGM